MSEEPFYQRWWNNAANWTRSLSSATYDTRQSIGRWVESTTSGNLNISQNSAQEALPYVAAGAVGLGTVLLNEPLGKVGKGLFNGIRWVVTGGGSAQSEGLLEKIPILGYGFKGLGWIADKLGDFSGYLLGGAAALVTFKLFENRGREPTTTASTGTGAVGAIPETVVLPAGTTEAHAPVRPAADPPAPGNPLPANLNPGDYAAIYAQRSEALTQGNTQMSEALRPWLEYNNRIYENRITFAKSAWLFNGTEGLALRPEEETDLSNLERTTRINRGARGRLLGALTGMGLSQTEAASMVPMAPPLPMHPIGDIDVPGDLRDFATRFQSTYGNDLIKVTENGTAIAKNFDAMSATQKAEFLDGALTYARERYRTIWNENVHNGYGWGGSPNPLRPIEGDFPNEQWQRVRGQYIDFSVMNNHRITGQKTYRHANGRVVNLKDEFKDFLAVTNGDTGHHWTNIPDPRDEGNDVAIVEPYNGYLAESRLGNGLQRLRQIFTRDVQPAIERHRAELAAAHEQNTGIIEPYARQILASRSRLNILKDFQIALVDSLRPQAEGSAAIQEVTAIDLRNPTLGANSPRMRWKGTFANGVFTVTEISLSPSAGFTRLDNPIAIDMNNPAHGMRNILGKVDEMRSRLVSMSPGIIPGYVGATEVAAAMPRLPVSQNAPVSAPVTPYVSNEDRPFPSLATGPIV